MGEVIAKRSVGGVAAISADTLEAENFPPPAFGRLPQRGRFLDYYFNRVQTCVLHSGATMQPFSFSLSGEVMVMVPE